MGGLELNSIFIYMVVAGHMNVISESDQAIIKCLMPKAHHRCSKVTSNDLSTSIMIADS